MARIFFVDDDPISRQLLGKAAKVLGHEPVLIEYGREVIPQAKQDTPDMIIMDMMMPDMSGLEVLAQLREQPALKQIPVVILSAGSTPEDNDRVKAAGAQAYLSKPISLNQLLETIQKFTAA